MQVHNTNTNSLGELITLSGFSVYAELFNEYAIVVQRSIHGGSIQVTNLVTGEKHSFNRGYCGSIQSSLVDAEFKLSQAGILEWKAPKLGD